MFKLKVFLSLGFGVDTGFVTGFGAGLGMLTVSPQ